VQVELPAGSDVPMPASSYALARQLIWLQQGELVFVEGNARHEMQAGDCLELGPPNDCRFINESTQPCVYLVVRSINLPHNVNARCGKQLASIQSCQKRSLLWLSIRNATAAGCWHPVRTASRPGKISAWKRRGRDARAGTAAAAHRFLSLDPYMRGRMSDAPSYSPPVAIGAVMVGGTVSRVVTSNHADYQPGDWVLGYGGWQDYELSDGSGLVKLGEPATPFLGAGILGMPGFTAYMGLLDIGQPKAGETLVVAAATGPVGATVGQIAKLKGCRTVGIAGGSEKCRYAVETLGFDACLDHRAPDFAVKLLEACPQGIDIYYENVGGKVFDAVLPLLNTSARAGLRPGQRLQRHRAAGRPGSSAAADGDHPQKTHPDAGLYYRPGLRASDCRVPAGDGALGAGRENQIPRAGGRRPGERAAGADRPAEGRELR
jgi:hypothetical protein